MIDFILYSLRDVKLTILKKFQNILIQFSIIVILLANINELLKILRKQKKTKEEKALIYSKAIFSTMAIVLSQFVKNLPVSDLDISRKLNSLAYFLTAMYVILKGKYAIFLLIVISASLLN